MFSNVLLDKSPKPKVECSSLRLQEITDTEPNSNNNKTDPESPLKNVFESTTKNGLE